MDVRKHSLKIHKPTVWVFLAIIIVFIVVTVMLLNKSDKKHHRKMMPAKYGVESTN
jgi:hypothetical protein